MGGLIGTIVSTIVDSASELLTSIGVVFSDVVTLLYNAATEELTALGLIIVATAGFALAWAGVRFVFSFIQKLLGRTRGGAR